MTRCYLGLGSNLRTPKRQLKQAIESLRKLPRTNIIGLSSVYSSKPLGIRAQPPYCNKVIAIHTLLPARTLLHHCQSIERKHQRSRKRHWGARTLDIDILLYGDTIVHTHDLSIPHPHMLMRDFVLIPLLEISPNVRLPNGQLIRHHLTSCEKHVYLR